MSFLPSEIEDYTLQTYVDCRRTYTDVPIQHMDELFEGYFGIRRFARAGTGAPARRCSAHVPLSKTCRENVKAGVEHPPSWLSPFWTKIM